MKKDYETMTVGEIVADNFGNAEVFDKYGIDFCCHGSILCPKPAKKRERIWMRLSKTLRTLLR